MRSQYVKVVLSQDAKTNLAGATVVGQGTDFLLLERAQPKERATPIKRRKKAEHVPEAVGALD